MMYKIFTLSVAIALLPHSPNIATINSPANNNNTLRATHIFPYKNTISTTLLEPAGKPAIAWSENWQATVQENIRKSEYNFKWEEKLQAYTTPNRKNNLRFFYNKEGFAVEPRTTKI